VKRAPTLKGAGKACRPACHHNKSAALRGYDHKWRRLRLWYIRQNPLCENCLRVGVTRQAADVDHVRPFNGRDDVLRLDVSNLMALCRACHNRKTHASTSPPVIESQQS